MAETVGSLVDKITIVQLKLYHHQEEVKRENVDIAHIEVCRKNMQILKEQLNSLVFELDELIYGIISGKKKLKVFRQFKMYNDPKFKRDLVE